MKPDPYVSKSDQIDENHLTSSPQDRSHLPSEWKWLYRVWRSQDSLLSVCLSVLRWLMADGRYGPRPKQPPYSPQGTLNLEVKFAPFASHPRRAPLRVSHLTNFS